MRERVGTRTAAVVTRAKTKTTSAKFRTHHAASSKRTPVIVLLSGGIDSACVVAAYQSAKHRVHALFADYGQPARRSELAAARSIAEYYDLDLEVARLRARIMTKDGEYFGRNALLMLLGAATASQQSLIVGLGIHSASPYYDTTSAFAADMQRVLDGYAGGTVMLGAPFLQMTKASIVKFARRNGVPLAHTYSCETKNAPACGACPSCADRRACGVD